MAVKVAEHISMAPETGSFTRRTAVQPRPWVVFFLLCEDVEIDRERQYNDSVPGVGIGGDRRAAKPCAVTSLFLPGARPDTGEEKRKAAFDQGGKCFD
jgi:hypothetical protein